MCTHANQGTGYARSANMITNYLAKSHDVVYFAFQNYANQTITDRYIDPAIRFIDAVVEDPDSPKGFGDRAILPAIQKENPDIIFIYNDISVCTSILKLIEGAGTTSKVYLYLDIVYPWEDIERFEYLKSKVDHCFVFLNCWVNHMVNELGWDQNKVSYLPLGVDLNKFKKLDDIMITRNEKYGFVKDDFVVLNLNRNSYRKQWCVTIKAFLIFLKEMNMDPHIKLMCSCLLKTDDGYDIRKLISTYCIQLGLPRETVLNKHVFINPTAVFSTEEEINIIYNSCDVGLNTCCGEGFGLVNMEHVSLGKPQILSGVPAFMETLGRDGHAYIIEPVAWNAVPMYESHGGEIATFRPEDFAAAVKHVYTHRDNPRSDTRTHIETTYCWERTYEALDKIFFKKMEFSTYTLSNKVNNFTIDVISDDFYIRNTLSNGHEWDSWMRSDIMELYKPGTDIIDVGGNIGCNALMFSDYGPVHTFEPLFHSVITKNVLQNILKNPVKVYPVGLSNVAETSLIYKPRPHDYGLTNYGGCSMAPNDEHHLPTGYPVKIDRLDDVYSGIPSIIKIDVELFEYQVILGAENTIRKHKPALYIEIFDFDTSPIIPFIKNIGYNTIIERPECNYLCICST